MSTLQKVYTGYLVEEVLIRWSVPVFDYLLSVQLLQFVLLCSDYLVLLTQPAQFGLENNRNKEAC